MPVTAGTINTTTTNFDKTLHALILGDLADNLRRKLVWLQPGAFMPAQLIPGTNLVRHISYGDMGIYSPAQSDGTPPWLTEGTMPTAEALTIGYDEFGVNQVGRLLALTDRALKYSPHNLYSIASERVSWNAISTIDAIIADTVMTIAATYANGKILSTLVAPGDILTAAQVRLAVAALRAASVPPIFGNDYGAFVHPYAIYDLMADTAWVNVANYAAPENMLTGEVGRLYGVRFIQSTVGTWVSNAGGAGTVPVYSTLFFGREFFAVGDFGSIEIHTVRPGGDHSDPLAQKALVGWKGWIGADVMTTLGTRARRLVHAGTVAGGEPLGEGV